MHLYPYLQSKYGHQPFPICINVRIIIRISWIQFNQRTIPRQPKWNTISRIRSFENKYKELSQKQRYIKKEEHKMLPV